MSPEQVGSVLGYAIGIGIYLLIAWSLVATLIR
jgi:hypothetical protein